VGGATATAGVATGGFQIVKKLAALLSENTSRKGPGFSANLCKVLQPEAEKSRRLQNSHLRTVLCRNNNSRWQELLAQR
jgi:hypothetical protein